MGRIVAGIGTSHVPSIGVAYDRGLQDQPAWKPLFDGYKPAFAWLQENTVDTMIVFYNDHGTSLFFDRYPTFAIGVGETHEVADEGYGRRPLPDLPGDPDLAWHLTNELVLKEEFDLTVCQELPLDHGLLSPLPLLWPHEPRWPGMVIPLAVNVLQHPLPTARRCFKLGQAIRRAVESFPAERRVAVVGTGGLSHQLHGARYGFNNPEWDNEFLDLLETDPETLAALDHETYMRRGGAESVEMIMWLCMRGAMAPGVRRIHRNYYLPMLTGMGLVLFEDAPEAQAAAA